MMGHHNIRFDGDTYSSMGAWGPPNSRANFCEEDYALTLYLAEFINSVTNLAYVYFGLQYMYGPGSHGAFTPQWDFMSVALLLLGIGSFLFHATLRQIFEFADEFSMLILSWSMMQATFTLGASSAKSRFISAGLTICFASFAIFYLRFPKIIYQVMAFTFSLLVIIGRSIYLFCFMRPAFPAAKARDWTIRTYKAVGIVLIGYAIWNVDLQFCATIRGIRRQVGLPWAWLFELHGWWHVLTAIGASQFMYVVREMREEEKREKAD